MILPRDYCRCSNEECPTKCLRFTDVTPGETYSFCCFPHEGCEMEIR